MTQNARGRLVLVNPPEHRHPVFHGVVTHVGVHMADVGVEVGHRAYYNGFVPVEDSHVVPSQHLLCFDDDE